MAGLSHAILVEGSCFERRMDKSAELFREHFADDPAAAEKINRGLFEDLLVLEPEDGKDITVALVEGLIELFKQKPFASTGKACLIPRGELMNDYAQNKMLKLLEEPPAGSIIVILTGNAQRLLPTVRSRLARIWLGYAEPERGPLTDDLRQLTAALIYRKGALADANGILSRYEGSREEAASLLGAFQIFLRDLLAGGFAEDLIERESGERKWIAESAAKIQKKHADRMRSGVLLAEKTLESIERGDRIRYALRGMALAMRGAHYEHY